MRKKTIVLISIFLVAFTIGCGNVRTEGAAASGAHDFTLEDINGDMVKLSDYSGSIIVLNFFATWCPPCRAEMPDFNEVAKEYKNDVKIIAVNVGRESLSKVRSFVRDNNLVFTVAMDDGRVSALYGPIRGIPVTVIIDRDFNIAKRYVGLVTKNTLIGAIKQIL